LSASLNSDLSLALYHLNNGDYVTAESEFRSVNTLQAQLNALDKKYGWHTFDGSGLILLGLADSLAGQDRHKEAAPLYEEALSQSFKVWSEDDFMIGDLLERSGAYLRKTGRVSEAVELENRALKVLDRTMELYRNKGAAPELAKVKARSDAIRNAQSAN
jgi:tetratricopeptide (TPR) repeat protein